MAKTLVLEWDSREARVIAISQKGRKWSVEDAFVVPLPARDASAGDKVVGPMLREAVTQRGLAGSKCKIVVGRSSIELRYLTVPQAPNEEMPDLVRFQALRQFTQLGEEWPLDFIPVSDSGETQLVLAASIVPSALDGLVDACKQAGLTPEQVFLRPFAAAANVADEAVAEGQERRLVVDVLTDEADLVVVDRGRPIFCRTVKLPTGPEVADARNISLVGEIRRTVAAAQNQIPGREISHISLFGAALENKTIIEKLQQASFTAEAIDPFAEVDPARLTEIKSSQRGSFAPLLGVAHLLSGASTPFIDFLHPRQRPLPPDNRRRNVLAISATVLLLLSGLTGYYYWSESMNSQVAELTAQIKKKKDETKAFDDIRAAATSLENFEKTNISAAEKLAQVSDLLPPGDRVLLSDFNLVNPQSMPGRGGKVTELPGSIELIGGAKELDDKNEIEKKLNELGTVKNKSTTIISKIPNYEQRVHELITFGTPKPLVATTKAASKPSDKPMAKPGDKAGGPTAAPANGKTATKDASKPVSKTESKNVAPDSKTPAPSTSNLK